MTIFICLKAVMGARERERKDEREREGKEGGKKGGRPSTLFT